MAGETERLTDALSMQQLSVVVARLGRDAELSEMQQRSFERWTESVRQGLISHAPAGLAGFRVGLDEVKREFRAVHAGVAAGWLARGHIDEELVCRRAFLGHLLDVVAPLVGAEPPVGKLVKAAA